MKNQYLADIGDYGKYALLRHIAKAGISVSVNWYLTPDDGSKDGKFRDYLKDDKEAVLDPELFEKLRSLPRTVRSTVMDLEAMDVIPGADYYHQDLEVFGRDKWLRACMEHCKGSLIYLDPDNGIRQGAPGQSADSIKFAYTSEIAALFESGRDVVCYCHRGRRNDLDWEKYKALLYHELQDVRLFCLTYHRGTQRSFLFAVHEEHADQYQQILSEFLNNTEKRYFTEEEVSVPARSGPTPTALLLSRQYPTYQALLQVYPKEGLSAEDCFHKTILYVVSWFRKRIDPELLASMPELESLRSYPEPDRAEDFRIEDHANIRIISLMSVRSFYWKEAGCWSFRIVEPDNGTEKKESFGRQFITDVSVTAAADSAVLAVRIICREPQGNMEDAGVFRPAFVKSISKDPALFITEAGTDPAFRFGPVPIMLNGKSQKDCTDLTEKLLRNPRRQMPVIFIPESYYEELEDSFNGMTRSLLGYGHVVVVTRGTRKLFLSCMREERYEQAIEEDQIIIHRGVNPLDGTVYETTFLGTELEEDHAGMVKALVMQEPLRKRYCYFEYLFNKELWNAYLESRHTDFDPGIYQDQIDEMKAAKADVERDNEKLSLRIQELERQLKSRDQALLQENREKIRTEKQMESLQKDKARLQEELKKLGSGSAGPGTGSSELGIAHLDEKAKYEPVLNFPVRFDKDDILDWVETYLGDYLIIHPKARRSFEACSRNIDYKRLCLMLYYLAHYTRLRNENKDESINLDEALRPYDLEDMNLSVTSVGDVTYYKSAIKIKIHNYDGSVRGEQYMPLHIKSDVNPRSLIRIYFLYHKPIGKSIIGYLPDHIDKV